MEFKELVEQRRSIRSYSEERITEEELKQIIECAQMAPSWKNSQTARYYAALSDEAIEAVRKALPVFNQNSSKNAAYIVSSFKKGVSGSLSEGELAQEGDLWGAYDLGLGNMYALFRAKELGYDTLIMGIRDTQALRDYFKIPEDEIILPVIAIGKGNGPARVNARKDLDEILKIR